MSSLEVTEDEIDDLVSGRDEGSTPRALVSELMMISIALVPSDLELGLEFSSCEESFS